MDVMPDFDLGTPRGKQDFQAWFTSLIRNEINSYSPSALSLGGGNPDQTLAAINQTGAGVVPTGTIVPYGSTTLPDGYLWCDGALTSKSFYANLYSVLGPNRFGADTASEFPLPDLKDKFVRGSSNVNAAVVTTNVNTHAHNMNAFSFTGSASNTGDTSVTHTHGVNGSSTSSTGDHNQAIGTGGPNDNFNRAAGNAGCAGTTHTHGGNTNTVGGHNHNNHGANTGNPSATNHSHSFTPSGSITVGSAIAQAHIPAYVGVNYIIKY
jgi:microcystin-dependent protein